MKNISTNYFKDYREHIILCNSIHPRKRIEVVLSTDNGPNNSLELYHTFHVIDKFDSIICISNHLSIAISQYNKLN